MKKDNKGRITNLVNAPHIHKGHSVCVSCGKDMLVCWDTVCFVCGDTSCYDCSHSDNIHWFCDKHRPSKIDLPVIELSKEKLCGACGNPNITPDIYVHETKPTIRLCKICDRTAALNGYTKKT